MSVRQVRVGRWEIPLDHSPTARYTERKNSETEMNTQHRKVDTKGRVVLPDQFAGRTVSVLAVSDTEVRIRITRVTRSRPSLEALLAGINPNDLPEKVDYGPPVGAEQL